MKTIVYKFIYAISVITSLMLCSCADDFPDIFGDIPEGEGNLSATVTFTPTYTADLKTTRTSGEAIQTINTLCVLVYTTDGKLVRKYNKEDFGTSYSEQTYKVKEEDHFDGGDQPHVAEAETAQATFTIPGLPYGRYRIYAVANMGDLAAYDNKIQTEEGLRNISLTWNEKNISANNQMFGFFTLSTEMKAKGFDADIITFNKAIKIHSWLKRAASKVTIAYDPSGLNQGVDIYIKNVTIRDIPATCLLGNVNTPTDSKELLNHLNTPYAKPDYKVQSEAIPNSRFYYDDKGIIKNAEGDPITTWDDLPADIKTAMGDKDYGLVLTNGVREAIPFDAHSASAQSLFFYENNQMKNEYENNLRYDKRPQHSGQTDGVGVPIREDKDDNDFKDRVPYGTYIEVEAYYISTNPQKVGEGSIKYRFMLGKDTKYNYNAQRNYHFKLTLGFNGWANEPDWHIDYDQPDPGLEVAPEFRVSYLYHQKSELPIRIIGNCTNLEVTIEENNWAPYDPTNPPFYVPSEDPSSTNPDPMYAFQWNYQAYFSSIYWNGEIEDPSFGFLALHLPNMNTTTIDQDYGAPANAALKAYYKANNEGSRKFEPTQLSIGYHNGPSENDNYYVTPVYDDNHNERPNQKTLLLPVWTRAKTLIKDSGFSGNNPYEGFERKAVLKIKADFNGGEGVEDGYTETKYVTVLQVKRLVNPKGVWRDKGRSEPFDVTLLEADNANGMSNFHAFLSEGEWSAFIDKKTNDAGFFLTQNPNKPDGCYMSENGDTIHGYTGTTIDFRINFNASVGNNSECAIVKVLYHGNQCLHKILVRKGYDDPIEMGGATWSSFSLFQAAPVEDPDAAPDTYDAVLTKNPLMLGSMFRRGRQSQGILVKNNMESEGGIGPLMPPGQNFQFMIAKKTNNGEWERQTWNDIGFRNDYNTNNTGGGTTGNRSNSFGTFISEDGTKYKVPSYDDWQKLTDEAEFGFGVVYGSAATEPQTTAEGAYGLIDPDNTGEFTDKRGMRGIIAYDKETGNQIFFPVGKYGTGRRTMFNVQKRATANGTQDNPNYYGVLRYADVYDPLTSVNFNNNIYRPIPYNLPIAAGNIYWIDVLKEKGGPQGTDCLGWDLNYFNFDFNAYTPNNYADACPIKLIKIK